MAAVWVEDLRELSRELLRDGLHLAEDAEAAPADPEHVACKAEEFIDDVGVISALSDQGVVSLNPRLSLIRSTPG